MREQTAPVMNGSMGVNVCLIAVTDDDSKTKLKVPGSDVTITLTTPSDKQGPSHP